LIPLLGFPLLSSRERSEKTNEDEKSRHGCTSIRADWASVDDYAAAARILSGKSARGHALGLLMSVKIRPILPDETYL
jgi:hypothetical protein